MNAVMAQRALEALRNGVPNADAVRALGCMQPTAMDRFREQLDRLAAVPADRDPPVVPGTLIAGDFGTGKSHTLSYFELEALKRNFVVSRLVISKETPLHDPSKLFLAAVRAARLPESRGSLMHELALRLDYRSKTAQSFIAWVKQGQPYGMLTASVLIDEQSHDAELKEKMVNWWSGDKLDVKQVRDGLRDLDPPTKVAVKAVKLADLALVRFEFAARLARAVGFAGWVLLLDEMEQIGATSLLQRARAYAELARWLGAIPEQGMPSITTVAAFTDDFDVAILQGKNDREKAPDRLKQKGDQRSLAQAMMANEGIDMITQEKVLLNPPSDDTLARSFELLRKLYGVAYGHVPSGGPRSDDAKHRAMRSYVRRWISEWDLDRLYGERAHDVIEEPPRPTDYTEQPDSESDNGDGERE